MHMLLRAKPTGDLIEVENLEKLFSPFEQQVEGRNQAGQEEQDTKRFKKSELSFPTGESLPKCWVDANSETKSSHD